MRPVSISYVTKDPHKILPRFSIFMERFANVSQILKLGNFPNFIRDLHNRLKDLEYTETQVALQSSDDAAPSQNSADESDGALAADGKLSLETLQQTITELKATIDQVEHHPVLFSSKVPENDQSEHTLEKTSEKESEVAEAVNEETREEASESNEKNRSSSVASSMVAMTRTVSRGLSTVTDLLPFKGPWINAFVDNNQSDRPLMSPSCSKISSVEKMTDTEKQAEQPLDAQYEVCIDSLATPRGTAHLSRTRYF